MDFGLTDDQREIQRTARELLAERAQARARARARRGGHAPTTALWRELCELGWPGIAVAEEHGGQGLGQVELSILCEELGRSLAPVPFLPSAMAATRDRAGRLAPSSASAGCRASPRGETIGALGAASRRRRRARDRRRARRGVFVLIDEDGSGRVLAREEAEVDAGRVDRPDPLGRARERRRGRRRGRSATAAPAPALDRALVAVSSELVGVCDRALEMTVAYVKDRKQFGVPVGSYQAVSHRCAQMLLDTEKARSTAAFAAWSGRRRPGAPGRGGGDGEGRAPRTPAARSPRAAIQMHGGIGFTWEADVHWLYKRAQLDAALLGGAKRHRARLAAILADRVGASAAA